MHRDDVVKLINARIDAVGIKRHLCTVRRVPSKVEVKVFVRNALERIHFRTGITSMEVEEKLNRLEAIWRHRHSDQIDLEDAIESKKPATKPARKKAR